MAGITYTSQPLTKAFRKNSGGLNSTSSPLEVADNESSDLQNIDFDRFGAILKRNGYTTLNSSAFNSGATWNSLHWYQITNTNTRMLVGTCGNKIAKMDDLDGTWDDITGSLTITAGNNNQTSWTTFLDTAIGTNNVDAPFQYTGSGNASALTVPTGLTKAAFVENFQNFAFLANVTVSGTTRPTRIHWSNINSISTWTATDFNDVGNNDGYPITGIKVLGEKLIIFKERSIWQAIFTGDPDIPFSFSQTPSTQGCIAPFSIQKVGNGIVFLAYDGFYFFDGYNSSKISDKVTTTILGFNDLRYQFASSMYQLNKNRYWCSFTAGGGATHSRVITWDSYKNAWSLYVGINANAMAIANIAGGQEKPFFGDYLGFVYQADNGLNDSPSGTATAIAAYYYTKWMDYDDVVNQKETPQVVIYYKINSATVTFSHSYDLEETDTFSTTFSTASGGSVYGSSVYGTGTYGASGGAIARRDLNGRGRVVRFKFKNSTLSETFRIDGFGSIPHLDTNE